MSSPISDYSSLFDLNPFPTWVYDVSTFEILDVNEAAVQHYGYSKTEFLQLTIQDLGPKVEVPKVLAAHSDIQSRKGNIYFGVFTQQKKSGEKVRIKINGHKVDFMGKKCITVVCQDVTAEEHLTLAMKASEERLKAASSIAKLGYWRQDMHTDTLTWSDEIFKIWGRDRSTFEVSIANFFGSIHPDDKRQFIIEQQATFEGKKDLDFVHRILLPDGSVKWVHELGRLIKNEDDLPLIFEGTVQDITTQKESELRLHKISEQFIDSEAKFRTIFEIASLGIAQVDPADGQIILVNSFYESITGYTTDELLKMKFVELTHPDDRKKDWEIFTKALRGDGEYRNEKRYIKKDGTIVWVRIHVAFIRDELGKPVRTVAICEDITSRKAEEQRLKLLESVITNSSDAVLITEAEPFDEPGPRIVYINEAFTNMTGYTANEVIGKTPRILQGAKSDTAELAKLSKALRNWETCEITTLNYKKNGKEFWINFSVTPVANESGWFTHWVAIEREVTEKKNQELEQNLLSRISLIFNEEKKLGDAAQKLSAAFAEFGGFDFVEVWTPNLENTQIQLLSYSNHSPQAEVFYDQTSTFRSFGFGEGLPGLVWKSKQALLLNSAENSEIVPRIEAALEAGLKSFLGLPLLFNDTIVGVLVFGSTKALQSMSRFVKLFNRLETFIGSEINRKSLESNLQNLFDAIPDIICLTDFQGRFLRINKGGCDLLGYSEEEILFHSFDEFVHPEDKSISTQEVMKLRQEETIFNFENRYLTKTGEIIWLSWTCNSEVEAGVIYASAKNISKEKKLSQLSDQASTLARIGSWEIDLKEGKLFWSEMVHYLHETDPSSYVPDLETGISFYRKDFHEMVQNAVGTCISDGTPFNFEAVLITDKNNERWVSAMGSAEMFEGKAIRVYGSFQDIHERKEAENRLQSLADNLPGVVFRYKTNPDGTDSMRYVSRGAKEIWGFAAEQTIQDNNLIWDGIKAGGDFEEVRASIVGSIKNKTKWTVRWRYIMPSGKLRYHQGYGTPEYLTDGSVLFNSLILDVTEEKKTEDLLEQVTAMARIGSWELDLINPSADALYWSPMSRQILEVDESYNPTLTGGHEFYYEESKVRIKKAVALLVSDGKEFDEEVHITTAKGEERWIRCIGKGQWVQDKCVKIFGSYQDIHQKKIDEIALQKSLKSLEDYKFSLDQSAIIAFTDNRGVITFVNENFCKISQYTEKEIIGNTHQLVNSGHHPKDFFNDLWKTIASGKVWRGEIKNLAKDGSFYWVDTTIVPFLDENKRPFQYLAIRFDITSRKIAVEKSIQVLEEKNTILERITEAFVSLDKDLNYTFMNKKAGEIFNRDPEQLIGKHIWTEFPEGINQPFYLAYKQAMATQQYIHTEQHYKTSDLWFENHIYPSPDGLSIFFRDISGRKRSEKKLLISEQKYRRLALKLQSQQVHLTNAQEVAKVGSWETDLSNLKLTWSDETYRIFDTDRENFEPTHENFQNYVHPLDREKVDKALADSTQDTHQTQHRIEHRILTTSGEEKVVEERWKVTFGDTGEPLLAVGSCQDITERKKAEETILKANERFEKVTEATNDAIWDWDLENKSYFRSRGIEKFFGTAASKTLNEDDFWTDKFHPEDLQKIRESIESALQDPEADRWEMQYRIFKENGEIGYILDKGIIIRDTLGKALRMVGAMTDISDRKLHEEELLKLNESLQKYALKLELTNEQLEQFAFIASHDLQEPLRMISSFLDQLKRKYEGQLDSKANQYIHFATDGAKRMKQIILDLLEYSRAGKSNDTVSKINLKALLKDFQSLRKKIIEEKSAVIIYSSLPVIEGFRAPFTQVIHCLLDNSIKYSQEGVPPRIELKVEENESEWTFTIRDNGLGIDPTFFDKIFIIFQRLHNRDQYEGSGIGLSIVKKQVESWGGKIWLESTPGQGSTFYFTLPKKSDLSKRL